MSDGNDVMIDINRKAVLTLNSESDDVFCEGCRCLKQKLEETENENYLNYATLKKKIISTDQLIQIYTTKTQDNENLTKKLDEMTKIKEQLYSDCLKYETDLSKALEELGPLRTAHNSLKEQKQNELQQNTKICDKLAATEKMLVQYETLLKEKEAKERENIDAGTLKKEITRKEKELEKAKDDSQNLYQKLQKKRSALRKMRGSYQKAVKCLLDFGDSLQSQGPLKKGHRRLMSFYQTALEKQENVLNLSSEDEELGDGRKLEDLVLNGINQSQSPEDIISDKESIASPLKSPVVNNNSLKTAKLSEITFVTDESPLLQSSASRHLHFSSVDNSTTLDIIPNGRTVSLSENETSLTSVNKENKSNPNSNNESIAPSIENDIPYNQDFWKLKQAGTEERVLHLSNGVMEIDDSRPEQAHKNHVDFSKVCNGMQSDEKYATNSDLYTNGNATVAFTENMPCGLADNISTENMRVDDLKQNGILNGTLNDVEKSLSDTAIHNKFDASNQFIQTSDPVQKQQSFPYVTGVEENVHYSSMDVRNPYNNFSTLNGFKTINDNYETASDMNKNAKDIDPQAKNKADMPLKICSEANVFPHSDNSQALHPTQQSQIIENIHHDLINVPLARKNTNIQNFSTELAEMKSQICLKKELLSPLSPLPPTPPPAFYGSQKHLQANSGMGISPENEKILDGGLMGRELHAADVDGYYRNQADISLHRRKKKKHGSKEDIPNSPHHNGLLYSKSPGESSNIYAKDYNRPLFHSKNKHLYHQQSEGFDVSENSPEQQMDYEVSKTLEQQYENSRNFRNENVAREYQDPMHHSSAIRQEDSSFQASIASRIQANVAHSAEGCFKITVRLPDSPLPSGKSLQLELDPGSKEFSLSWDQKPSESWKTNKNSFIAQSTSPAIHETKYDHYETKKHERDKYEYINHTNQSSKLETNSISSYNYPVQEPSLSEKKNVFREPLMPNMVASPISKTLQKPFGKHKTQAAETVFNSNKNKSPVSQIRLPNNESAHLISTPKSKVLEVQPLKHKPHQQKVRTSKLIDINDIKEIPKSKNKEPKKDNSVSHPLQTKNLIAEKEQHLINKISPENKLAKNFGSSTNQTNSSISNACYPKIKFVPSAETNQDIQENVKSAEVQNIGTPPLNNDNQANLIIPPHAETVICSVGETVKECNVVDNSKKKVLSPSKSQIETSLESLLCEKLSDTTNLVPQSKRTVEENFDNHQLSKKQKINDLNTDNELLISNKNFDHFFALGKGKLVAYRPLTIALGKLEKANFRKVDAKLANNVLCLLLNPISVPTSDCAISTIILYLGASKKNPLISVLENSSEPPLLPPMEKCIVSILLTAEAKSKSHLHFLVHGFLAAVLSHIFNNHNLGVYGMSALCRVYAGICRQLSNLERPRVLCYDLLQKFVEVAPYLIASIVGVWPEVLSLGSNKEKKNPLGMVFMFLLFKKPSTLCERLLRQSAAVFASFCHFTIGTVNTATELAAELMQDIKEKDSAGSFSSTDAFEYMKALELLAAREGWEWTNNVLILKLLWPFLQEWGMKSKEKADNIKDCYSAAATVVKLLGFLGHLCPQDDLEGVKFIMNTLQTLLLKASTEAPFVVKEAALTSLIHLIPYGKELVIPVLQSWLPQNEEYLTEETKKIIRISLCKNLAATDSPKTVS